jgi:sugar lactone lactonase YvrE
MRTIVRNWKQALLASTVLALGAWLIAPQARAEEPEKPKAEAVNAAKDKDAAKKKQAELREKVRKAQEEAQRKAMEAYENEQKKEDEARKSDPAWKPSHQETSVIKMSEAGKPLALNNFCLNSDGNILAACGGERLEYSQDKETGEYVPKTVGEPSEIRVLSPEGKLLKTWTMPFKAEAVCVADDGAIFVAGGGQMAKLDQEGKVLLTAKSPQMADLPPLPPLPEKKKGDEDKAAKEARKKKIAELRAELDKAMKAYQNAVKEAKPPENPTEADMEAIQMKLQEPQAKLMAAQQKLQEASLSPEMLAMQKRAEIQRKSAVNGIAVTKDDVFVACSMAKGYGFAVWRVDREFAKPKQIIENLRGCCGQMDIQAKDGEVWVAHNAAHKVERYDRDGKKLASFGNSGRTKAEDFGGCCEPKNLRFNAKGEVLAAESGEPVAIKRFTTDGKFLGVVGVPKYQTGCVRVTIDVSRDGKQIFILDPGGNAIHVLTEKAAEPEKKAESETDKPAKG